MDTLSGFDFVALDYDGDGKPTSTTLTDLQQHVASHGTTDLILMAHGFRNNASDARRLYGDFLGTFRANMVRPELTARLAPRTFAVGGVFWPSKPFNEGDKMDEGGAQSLGDAGDELEAARAQLVAMRDEDVKPEQRAIVDQAIALLPQLEDDAAKQDEFVALLLSVIDADEDDPNEGFSELKSQRGSELLEKLRAPIILPTRRSDDDGGVQAIGGGDASGDGRPLFIGGLFKSIAGRVGQFLNMGLWYTMKKRSGIVGAEGVAKAVRTLKQGNPALRVHLVGHSLGGRCMTACANALSASPMIRPDSVSLLEAAFSHYGLSANNGKGGRGFFRDVIEKQVVKGPFISTFSYQDTVVGKAYAISSRLAGDNTKAIGDKDDQFGGIGRNGTQKCVESTTQPMSAAGRQYTYAPNVVNNIDGSGGFIKDHGDVTNADVTYAVACAIATT
ncbi:MAG: hypothetical protein H7305_09800 [Gemmatimonadaceae bacterium]|nr:hypothetical protein [Gemmatimonadaceae bacterium]